MDCFENVRSLINEEALIEWETDPINASAIRTRRRLNYVIALDTLQHACDYLAHSWGVDTPRDRMVGNLDARMLLINLRFAICAEAEISEKFDDPAEVATS